MKNLLKNMNKMNRKTYIISSNQIQNFISIK
jgi:hypothetical protein